MASVIQQEGGALVPGGVYRISVYCYQSNQMAINNVHLVWNLVAGLGGDSLGAILQTMCDGMLDVALKAILSNTSLIVGAKMSQELLIAPPLPGIITYGVHGTAGTQCNPTQVAGLLRFTTAHTGRAYRGRIFLPFPPTASIDTDGTPDAGYVSLSTALFTNWYAGGVITFGANTYTWFPCIYHRKTAKSGTPAAGTYTPIVAGAGVKLWATQRKRGDLGKTNVPFIS